MSERKPGAGGYGVPLSELVGALGLAIDLGMGQPLAQLGLMPTAA